MSAEVGQPLNKVDSHVEPESTKKGHGKSASVSEKVSLPKLEDIPDETKITIAKETLQLNWKINTSPSTIDDKEALKELLITPKVKKLDLTFPVTKQVVSARNLKGVLIKDALDAIYKANKKKEDDELTDPYLKGFELDRVESRSSLFIHLQRDSPAPKSGKKKGKKGGDE